MGWDFVHMKDDGKLPNYAKMLKGGAQGYFQHKNQRLAASAAGAIGTAALLLSAFGRFKYNVGHNYDRN